METCQFYIDDNWVDPLAPDHTKVINLARKPAMAKISLSIRLEVDRAVSAAKSAGPSYAETPVAQLIEWFTQLLDNYRRRADEMNLAMTMEMRSPSNFARDV